MPWYSAFYFGGGGTVLIPIETVEFEVAELAELEVMEQSPVFAVTTAAPVFDFAGEPVFEPLEDGADFNVQC